MTVGFIGLGNMAGAMIGGMLEREIFRPKDIIGSAKTQATLERMQKKFGIRTTTDNRKTAKEAEVLILAVKPVFLPEVIEEIRDIVTKDMLIISIAAGKTMDWIKREFKNPVKLLRCMPNTPALVGEGCTAVCADETVKEEEIQFCMKLMGSFGKAIAIPERLMDAAGAVGGSSPAFAFMFMEAMADGAVAAGMPRGQAYEFAAQALLGSAKLMLESGLHPGELKDMVCSPGGTTIEGVRVLEERGMRSSVIEALAACVEKSKKL